MFPRKKRNRTGTISVVVVDKSRGGFKEVKSFGVAKTEEEADRLYAKASEWIRRYGGQQEIDFAQSSIVEQEFLESERVLNNISAVVLNGPQQILNQVYDSIGFNRIRDEVLHGQVVQQAAWVGTADKRGAYIPIIDDFIQRFDIKDFVIVADSGLLNKTNVELLRQAAQGIQQRSAHQGFHQQAWIQQVPYHQQGCASGH